MKRLLLVLALVISSLLTLGQSYTEIYFPNNGYTWLQVGNSCAGCSSFFVGAVRSDYPNAYGNYKYTIYYQTNSLDIYGNPRMTYISGIKYYYWTNQWSSPDNYAEYWVLVEDSPFLAYNIYSTNPQLRIKIIIGNYVIR